MACQATILQDQVPKPWRAKVGHIQLCLNVTFAFITKHAWGVYTALFRMLAHQLVLTFFFLPPILRVGEVAGEAEAACFPLFWSVGRRDSVSLWWGVAGMSSLEIASWDFKVILDESLSFLRQIAAIWRLECLESMTLGCVSFQLRQCLNRFRLLDFLLFRRSNFEFCPHILPWLLVALLPVECIKKFVSYTTKIKMLNVSNDDDFTTTLVSWERERDSETEHENTVETARVKERQRNYVHTW